MTPPVLLVWGRQAIANDMARLQELEDDLRHDINERSKMTSSNRKLAKEQQRQAMRRRREKKRQHAREHADVPDTTWKFGDNDDIAKVEDLLSEAMDPPADALGTDDGFDADDEFVDGETAARMAAGK